MKIKNILSAVIILATTSIFAQTDFKCHNNTYKVPGSIVYSTTGELKEEHYAGMVDGYVQFTIYKYNKEGKVNSIVISLFPVSEICTIMNSEWDSKSKTTEVKDPKGDHIVLTLGSTLMDSKDHGYYISDRCIPWNELSSPNDFKSVMRTATIDGKFTSGKEVLKLVDEIIAAKKK